MLIRHDHTNPKHARVFIIFRMYVDELSQSFLEMGQIGLIPSKTKKLMEVYVHSNEGENVPHFHVRDYSRSNVHELDICIKFEKAEYFSHGAHQGTLKTKETKELDRMLRTYSDKYGETYWQRAVRVWNAHSSGDPLPTDIEQPDYSLLNF